MQQTLSGPELATARRAAAHPQSRSQGEGGGGGGGRRGGGVGGEGASDNHSTKVVGQRLGIGRMGLGSTRVSRRARWLLVGVSLACALVLCTVATIISGGGGGGGGDGGVHGGHGDGQGRDIVPSSSSSFSFGRRALLQTGAGGKSNNANTTNTGGADNTAGGTNKEGEKGYNMWDHASTILALSASGASGAGASIHTASTLRASNVSVVYCSPCTRYASSGKKYKHVACPPHAASSRANTSVCE